MISAREQIDFAKNMSIMLKAGISIDETLTTLIEQAESKKLKRALEHVINRVRSGMSLSESMEQEKSAFGPVFISLVRAGETSGTLESNLEFLTTWMGRDSNLRREVKNATLYPKIVGMLMLGLIIVLVGFVLPRILPIFERLKVDLPITTRIIVKISEIFTSYWIFIAIGIAGLVILWKIFSKRGRFRVILDKVCLRVPILGSMIHEYQIALLMHLIGILYQSGISLQESMGIASQGVSNTQYKKSVALMRESVQRGTSLKQALEQYPNLYPGKLVSIIAVGERSGTLDKSLMYLSDYYSEEILYKTQKLPSVLEPVLLIFVGVLIAFIALSIITPIYEITNSINP